MVLDSYFYFGGLWFVISHHEDRVNQGLLRNNQTEASGSNVIFGVFGQPTCPHQILCNFCILLDVEFCSYKNQHKTRNGTRSLRILMQKWSRYLIG